MNEVVHRMIFKLTKLIAEKPTAVKYHFRSLKYLQLKCYREALADADKALELKEDDLNYRGRGKVYFAMKKFDRALADYLKAVELNPDIEIENTFGYMESILNAKRAEVRAEQIAREVPTSAFRYLLRADSFFGSENYDEALADYSKLIELESDAFHYKKRGDCYFAMKKFDEALADYCKAVELEPDIEIEKHHDSFEPTLTEQRIIAYTKEIKRKPYSSHLIVERGHLYFELGNYKKAISDYDKAIIMSRGCVEADAYYRNAQAHYRLGHRRKAIENFRKALKIYPKFHINDTHVAEACFECGVACYESKRYAEAIADFDRYIFFKPEDPEGYRMRGKCYRKLRDESRAQADFARIGIRGRRLF